MTTHATAKFDITKWEEKPYDESDGKLKLTRASVGKKLSGDIEGEATLEYLMVYLEDGTASYVGHEHIRGKLGGREGTFVLEHTGTDDGKQATVTLKVVDGSGTGGLRGLKGSGGFVAGRSQPEYSFSLDYELE